MLTPGPLVGVCAEGVIVRCVMAKRSRWLIAPIAAGTAVLAGREPALARIAKNTFEPTASLSAKGHVADGAALIECTEGERVKIRVTFTQGPAIGEGRTQGECTGAETRYPVKVVARGSADFQPGRAEACAVAVDTDHGKVVDTRQWCRADGVELVED